MKHKHTCPICKEPFECTLKKCEDSLFCPMCHHAIMLVRYAMHRKRKQRSLEKIISDAWYREKHIKKNEIKNDKPSAL